MDRPTGNRQVIVVGAGPAGVVLTYLLARAGVDVLLLESRGDFARRFRGDTLAPTVLEYLATLGLAEPLLAELPHARSAAFCWHTPTATLTLADYRWASRAFPYYALIPQARFLPWLAERAQRLGASVELGARFRALRRDGSGRVVGVEYTQRGQARTASTALVVGADGRSSKVRQVSLATPTELGASLDILWCSLPRRPGDPALSGLDLFAGPGTSVALLGQEDDTWQLGYTIPAGTLPQLRDAGAAPVRDAVRRSLPWLGDRLDDIADLNDLTLLPVRITRVDRWWEPGLLLIGDAAHVISPVGGNGINFAVADAAEAANQLVGPLRARPVDPAAVDAASRAVEASRRPPVEREQAFQVRVERATARRLRERSPRPPRALSLIAAVPGLALLSGRRSRIEVPAPAAAIRHGTGPVVPPNR